jgi:hypothetical protein
LHGISSGEISEFVGAKPLVSNLEEIVTRMSVLIVELSRKVVDRSEPSRVRRQSMDVVVEGASHLTPTVTCLHAVPVTLLTVLAASILPLSFFLARFSPAKSGKPRNVRSSGDTVAPNTA